MQAQQHQQPEYVQQDSLGDEHDDGIAPVHEMQQIYGKQRQAPTRTGKRKAVKQNAAIMAAQGANMQGNAMSKYQQARGKKAFSAHKQILGGTAD